MTKLLEETKEKSRKRLQSVVDASRKSQTKFGESLKRPGYPGLNQQTLQRYLSGGSDLSEKAAREIVRVYGGRVSYLMGLDDIPSEMDETAMRMNAWRDSSDKRQTAFALLASLNGWSIEETPPLAAPYGSVNPSVEVETAYDSTADGIYHFLNFATITRNGESRTMTRIEFDRLMDKFAALFDLEIEHSHFEADEQHD